jgi:DNA-binding transcriptional regulator YiaG
MITGEVIREAREKLGESQAEFAKRFGVVQSVVSRWEAFGIPSNGSSKTLVRRVLAELGEAVP